MKLPNSGSILKRSIPLLFFCPLTMAATQTVEFTSETAESYFTQLGITAFFSYDDASLKPLRLGVRIPQTAIRMLRVEGDENYLENDGRLCHEENCAAGHRLFIELPPEQIPVENFPFRFFQVNFNPEGYSRPARRDNPNAQLDNEILGRPLIGVHAYAGISSDEIKQILPGNANYVIERPNGNTQSEDSLLDAASIEKVRLLPAPELSPPDYRNLPQSSAQVPWMGTHWLDTKAFSNPLPEGSADPMLMSLFYGSYNGEFVFIEPVIYQETFLDLITACSSSTQSPTTGTGSGSGSDETSCVMRQCYSIRQPDSMSESGFYPTSYCLNYNPPNFDITYEQFAMLSSHDNEDETSDSDETSGGVTHLKPIMVLLVSILTATRIQIQ